MTEPGENFFAKRQDQMFLRFDDLQIARLSRFGERRHYVSGEHVARVGDKGVGLKLILSG